MPDFEAPTGTDLVQHWLSRGPEGRQPHLYAANCPRCDIDVTTKIGIQNLAYTFDTCECGTPEYGHLVERLWHLECLAGPVALNRAVQELLGSLRWWLTHRKNPGRMARHYTEQIDRITARRPGAPLELLPGAPLELEAGS